VLEYLRDELGIGEKAREAWYRHWVEEGLAAFEASVAGHPGTGRLCAGDTPTLADLCLIPQLYNARRFECNLSGYPELVRIESECLRLEAFAQAAPEAQPDFGG
jgi:maleylpyruvate isomerase